MKHTHTSARLIVVALAIVTTAAVLTGCAPGDSRFTPDDPVGFWMGLWHGIISCLTLIIGIFSETVEIYERNNSGGWYDFGFLIGATAFWGGGSRGYKHGQRRRGRSEREEWEETGRKVEAKIKSRIRAWADAEPEENWTEVEKKAEAKLKRIIIEWAEREDEPDETADTSGTGNTDNNP